MTIDQRGGGATSKGNDYNNKALAENQITDNILPLNHTDSGEKDLLLLTNYQVSLDGVFLSLPNASIPYEDIFTAWEDAFVDYLFLSPEEFLAALGKATGEDNADSAPNFLNVAWEELFNIPVTEGGGEMISVTQISSEGGVISIEKVFDINAGVNSLLNTVVSIQSVPVTFSIPFSVLQPLTILIPVIPFPEKPVPGTPTLSAGNEIFPGVNAPTLFANELFLNTYESVVIQGNIFNGAFGYPVGATPGAGASITGIDVSFGSENLAGGTESNPAPGVIVLTTVQGNTLTFYTAAVDGHQMGDFFYTLNNAILTPPVAGGEVIVGPDTIKFYLDGFLYSITNNFGNSNVGQLNFLITDDKPVAHDQSAPDISESDIANVGSAGETSPAVVAGSLITPIALNGDLIVNPSTSSAITPPANASYFGANGGTVSSVTFDQALGATKDGTNAVTATSTQEGSDIIVTDNLGNVLRVNMLTGEYSYTLNAAFHDNIPDTTATIIFNYTFTDNEGQTASAHLTIDVADDAPVANNVTGSDVFEAGLPNGSDSSQTVISSGSLIGVNGNTFGADDGSVTAVTTTMMGWSSSTDPDTGVITVSDGSGNQIVINPDGSYTFTLGHAVTNVNNAPLSMVFHFTFTDGDGSTASADLTINVNDDAPIANNVTGAAVFEAGLPAGTTPGLPTAPLISSGNLIGTNGNTFGADGGTVTNATTTMVGWSTNISATHVITVSDGLGNQIVINPNGSYSFTLGHAVTNVGNAPLAMVFHFTFTDGDGSVRSADLTINVNDDAPIANNITGAAVFESGLPAGTTAGSPISPLISSGNLIGTNGNVFGADGGTVTNATTTMVGWSTNISATHIITVSDGLGNQIVINPNGSYSFTLAHAVDNVNNQPFDMVFHFTFTDGDGSTASADLTISVNDDAPIANNVNAGEVFEAGLAGGTSPGDATTFVTGSLFGAATGNTYGADGAGLISKVTFGNTDYIPIAGVITAQDGFGNILTVNADGSYTYTLTNPVTNVDNLPLEIVFHYTLTDADGSTAVADLTITVNDDAPVAHDVTATAVDEAGLPGGTAEGVATLETTGNLIGGLAGTFGADGGVISKINFGGTDHIPDGVTGIITIDDGFGNLLVVNSVTGEYGYILEHPVTNVGSAPLDIVFHFTLADGDGSEDSADLTIRVNDDTPVTTDVIGTSVNEAGLPGGSQEGMANLTSSGSLVGDGNSFGADGGVIAKINFGGTDYIPAGTGIITVNDGFGNLLVVNSVTGIYGYILEHAVTNVGNAPLDMIFHFTFADADGSESTSDLIISVNDDAPVTNNIDAGEVFESGLAGGSDPGGAATSVTGNLFDFANYGADGAGFISKIVFGSTTYLPDGEFVINAQDGFGNTLEVNADGSYTYTLINPVTNVDGEPLEIVFHYTLTDADGSENSADLTISVNDDTPAAAAISAGTVDEADIPEEGSSTPAPQLMGAVFPIATTGTGSGTAGSGTGSGTGSSGSGVGTGVGTGTSGDGSGTGTGIGTGTGSGSGGDATGTGTGTGSGLGDGSATTGSGAGSGSGTGTGIGTGIGTGTAGSGSSSGTGTGTTTATTTTTIFGADGAATNPITSLTFTSATNTSGVVAAIVSGATTINGHAGIEATDSLGNSLVIDQVAGVYYYTLNAAFTNTTPNSPVTETFTYEIQDADGSISTNVITITIDDYIPPPDTGGGAGRVAGPGFAVPSDTDTPIAVDQSLAASTITHSIFGNFFTLPGNSAGEDGIGQVLVSGEPTYATSTNGSILTITDATTQNSFSVNIDTGDYTFTYNGNTANGTEVFNYTLVDADGSSAAATLTITGLDQAVAPVILDLDGNGIKLVSAYESAISINDIAGNGNQQHVGWIGSGDGILMLDTHGDGKLSNINQISFVSYMPDAKTDLQGLVAFDTNQDHMLNAGDKNFNQFGVLLSNGKFESLSQLGIVSISLNSDNHQEEVNGNTVYGNSHYNTTSGAVYSVADVGLAIDPSAKGAVLHTQDIITDKQPIDFSKLPEMQPPAQPSGAEHSSNASAASATPAVTVSHEGSAQFAAGVMSEGDVQHITEQLNVHQQETITVNG